MDGGQHAATHERGAERDDRLWRGRRGGRRRVGGRVEPVLRGDVVAGRKVRLLSLSGPVADDIESEAMRADTGLRARHAADFERVAVVSDESWIRGARGFAVGDLPAAKTWLADGLETPS